MPRQYKQVHFVLGKIQSIFLTPTCRDTQLLYTSYPIKIYSRTGIHVL